MNKPVDSAVTAESAWTSGDHHPLVPDTSSLPDADEAAAPAVALMKRVVRGAHESIDELADSAAPTVRQLGDAVSGAKDAVHAASTQIRATGDAWIVGVRSTVRKHPLASVLGALALGALLGRLRR